MRRLNWWLYSVVFGSMPILVRFLLYIPVPSADINFILDDSDLVSSGLILCIGNIKELELQVAMSDSFKAVTKVIQQMLIISMSGLLLLTYLLEVLIKTEQTITIQENLTILIRWATLACFLLSLTVYYHKDFDNGN